MSGNRFEVFGLSNDIDLIDLTTPPGKKTYGDEEVFNDKPANKLEETATTFHNVGEGRRWPSAEMIREKLGLDK